MSIYNNRFVHLGANFYSICLDGRASIIIFLNLKYSILNSVSGYYVWNAGNSFIISALCCSNETCFVNCAQKSARLISYIAFLYHLWYNILATLLLSVLYWTYYVRSYCTLLLFGRGAGSVFVCIMTAKITIVWQQLELWHFYRCVALWGYAFFEYRII